MQSSNKKRTGNELKSSNSKLLKNVDTVSVNEFYFNQEFVNKFSKAKSDKKDVDFSNKARFYSRPFPCAVLPDFLNSLEFIETLKQELKNVKMLDKNSDLFQFKQSDDLANSSSPAIKRFIKILYDECVPWMEKLTGASLTNEIDMTCSTYNNTDVLLCHDDMLRGRSVAYIYYLVSDWSESDGGMLDIFETQNSNAGDIAFSILPVLNNFVFFEVSPASFHQVAEVLSNKTRLSINGWFHSDSYEMLPKKELHNRIFSFPGTLEEDELTQWINPIYFDMENILQIKKEFEETSEIELPNFLQKEKYELITETLKSDSTNWMNIGQRNKKYYYECSLLPAILEKCVNVLHSEEMCFMLSNLTGIPLHPLINNDSNSESDDSEVSNENPESCKLARYHSSVRKWSPGCYTLLHDSLLEGKAELDTILHFNCDSWNSENGGFTSYVAKGETDELLRIEPKSNSFGLVYTDDETAGFVKYINNQARSNQNNDVFYNICTTFYEQK